MSSSFTFSASVTFTATHAKHIAAKVATDLKRMQRFYGLPSNESIANYETEVIELLKNGYLGTVTYGFKRGDDWIEPALRYTSKELSDSSCPDDDPGKVSPNADIRGASFYSYLTYSASWINLAFSEKEAFKQSLPFQRGGAEEPGISGYLANDKTYSSGNRALNRSSVKNY